MISVILLLNFEFKVVIFPIWLTPKARVFLSLHPKQGDKVTKTLRILGAKENETSLELNRKPNLKPGAKDKSLNLFKRLGGL